MSELQDQRPAPSGWDGEWGQYRAISALAVAGVLAALVSILAFWHPILWVLPAAAVIVNVLALRRIARSAPELIGRGVALAGLGLALVLAAAAPTRYFVWQWRSRLEARDLALRWFEALREGHPAKAVHMILAPNAPLSGSDDLWAYYRGAPDGPQYVRTFASEPAVRAILALGPAAHVRPLGTEEHYTTNMTERLTSLFAVTYDRAGKPSTFLVRILLERKLEAAHRTNQWRLLKASFVDAPPQGWPQLSDKGAAPAAAGS
ncbi:MAG: hypothetical protein HYX69_04190 [Planctomycetia bacterium]|nr:hypothetical protein [Planctomycetia bacterium]